MSAFIDDVKRTESPINPDLLVRLDFQARTIHACLGLATEIGELVDPIKRHIFYGAPLDRPNIKEEIGDVLYYLGILCDVHGITLEDCMEAVITKLKIRYPAKFCSDKAVNRDLAAEQAVYRSPPLYVSDIAKSPQPYGEGKGPVRIGGQ